MTKRKLIDMLILILAYLFCSSFPWSLFIEGDLAYWLIPSFQIIMQAIFLFFWIFFIRKSSLQSVKIKANIKNLLLLSPVLVIFASNFLYGAFVPGDFAPHLDWTFALKVVLNFGIVVNEEMIFRYMLIGNMDLIKKPIWKIVIGAAIFGLCHISQFLSTFNPADLIVILYTFGLGLVLCFLYVYCGAPCTCICLHLLFNLVNGIIFEGLFNVSQYLTLILVSCGVGLFYAIYIAIIYFVRLRKCEVYNVRGELL